MDWPLAIERNRAALVEIVAKIFAMVGLSVGGTVERLPQAVRAMVLRLLQPAESALRRLIVVAAHGLVLEPVVSRPMPKGLKIISKGGSRPPSFRLWDTHKYFVEIDGPRRRFCKPSRAPRIWTIGGDPIVPLFRPAHVVNPVKPTPVVSTTETGLTRRLTAIHAALADLPKQARRLVRWKARRALNSKAKFRHTLRPGPPPGQRKGFDEDVDVILRECQYLAHDLPKLNSS